LAISTGEVLAGDENSNLYSGFLNPPILLKTRADDVVETLPGGIIRGDYQSFVWVNSKIFCNYPHALRLVHDFLDPSLLCQEIERAVYISICEASDGMAEALILLPDDGIETGTSHAALQGLSKGTSCLNSLMLFRIAHE
jgi:hypothetical protein